MFVRQICAAEVEEYMRGICGIFCKFSEERHPRHVTLNDIIKRGLQGVAILFILEPVTIERADCKKPDGTPAFLFSNGKSLPWDATCTTDTYTLRKTGSK